MWDVREPACAGRFYPADAAALERVVEEALNLDADGPVGRPRAAIAPHAGYRFSGPTAGQVLGRLARRADDNLDRVVMVGPSHVDRFDGLAVPSADAFETPLGEVPVDRGAVQRLVDRDAVAVDDGPHRREHSLETHLPFLQVALDGFEIVPIATGRAQTGEVAAALAEAARADGTVVSVSSDLSHYLDHETAQRVDERTRRAIEEGRPAQIGRRRACGHLAIRGCIELAESEGWRVETLDMRTSGDTAGGRDEVVGYGAWAFA